MFVSDSPLDALANRGKQPLRGTMRQRLLVGGAAFCLACSISQAQTTATVNLSTHYQTLEGWGTSLAWWANVVGGYPVANRNQYMTDFFDVNNGIGLNIVRYNIGGGENPAYLPPNTTYLDYRARVPGFEASLNNYDWTQDANQRAILQQSISMGANIQEAFSNSPPYWMTNSGSVTGAHGSGDNLPSTQYANFADYLTTVVKHFHDSFGITFSYVEALNEPASGYWQFGKNQEGADFAPASQALVIQQLASSLASKGMTYTKVSASDETSIDVAVSTFNSFDTTTRNAIAKLTTHTYGGSQRTQLQQLAAANGKKLWMTEHGDGDGTGLTMANSLVADMRQMQPTAWVYWQAVDSAPGWGFGINPLDGTANYTLTLNEKYYAMGNFSKYIRPGFQFVGMSDGNSLAAYDGKNTVVIVSVNSGSSAASYSYQLQNFAAGSWQVVPHRTSGSENLSQLTTFNASGSFNYSLPAQSITTFVLTNSSAGSGPITSGTSYHIVNQNSGLLVEDPGASKSTGVQMDQWPSNAGANQSWLATSVGSNWTFANAASGLVLEDPAFSTTVGGPIDQYTSNGGSNQLWAVNAVGDGSFKLVNQASNLLLDVVSASKTQGALVDQYTDNAGTNQHWTFQ